MPASSTLSQLLNVASDNDPLKFMVSLDRLLKNPKAIGERLDFELPFGKKLSVTVDKIPGQFSPRGGKDILVLRNVDNMNNYVFLEDVVNDAGIKIKFGDDGFPIIDYDNAKKPVDITPEVAKQLELQPNQVAELAKNRFQFLENMSVSKFLQQLKKSRTIRKNAAVGVEAPGAVNAAENAAAENVAAENAINAADDAKNSVKVENEIVARKDDPNANPLDEDLAPFPAAFRVVVESTLAAPSSRWTDWFKFKPAKPTTNTRPVLQASPVSNKAAEQFVEEDLVRRTAQATGKQRITSAVGNQLDIKNSSSWLNRKTLAAGLVGMSVLAAEASLMWYLIRRAMAGAAAQHRQDINGCWLYNKLDGTKVKVQVLSCGKLDLQGAIETCATQNYSSLAPSDVRECSTTTFNPCLADSVSRSVDSAVPLVPNICSKYVYKGAIPGAVSGVTLIDACKNLDGSALHEAQSCSPYCKTENFILPDHLGLMCIDVDYTTAFVDLVDALGYDPVVIFPPKIPAASSSVFSKPLLITTAVLGFVFAILGMVYLYRRRRT